MFLAGRSEPNRHAGARGSPRATAADLAIVAAFAVVAWWLGAGYVREARHTNRLPDVTGFEQQTFGSAVMAVCGRGLITPVLPLVAEPGTPPGHRPLMEFLTQRREALSCADVPRDVPVVGLEAMQRASRYLILLCELPWATASPSWAAFDHLLGAMFALTIVLAYLTCRALMCRVAAAVVTGLFLISPLHLANLVDVRDYAKAPFFLATLLVIALLVIERRRAPVVLALAAAGGFVTGFGFGIRTDVAVNLLLVVTAAVALVPGRLADSWKIRIASGLVAVAAFAAAAAPIIASHETASNAAHWALLGYGRDFDGALGIAPAPYETGYFYDDSYVASIVDAYHARTTRSAAAISVGMPAYAEASRQYYTLVLTTFPADALLRCWAAVIQVVRMPFTAADQFPPGLAPGAIAALAAGRSLLLRPFALVAVPLFALVLLSVSMASVRLASAMFVVAATMGGYPAIQFQTRHFFHLEIIPLCVLGMVAAVAWRVIREPRGAAAVALRQSLTAASVVRGSAFAGAIVLVAMGPLTVLRAYQQRTATELLEHYEGSPLVPIRIESTAVAPDSVRIAGADDVLGRRPAGTAVQSAQVAVDITGDDCVSAVVPVTFRYRPTIAGFDYSRTLDVPVPPAGSRARVFFPVLETGASAAEPHRFSFQGIDVRTGDSRCIAHIGRLAQIDALPLIVPAVLPAGWHDLPLHQTLRRVERPAIPDGAHD